MRIPFEITSVVDPHQIELSVLALQRTVLFPLAKLAEASDFSHKKVLPCILLSPVLTSKAPTSQSASQKASLPFSGVHVPSTSSVFSQTQCFLITLPPHPASRFPPAHLAQLSQKTVTIPASSTPRAISPSNNFSELFSVFFDQKGNKNILTSTPGSHSKASAHKSGQGQIWFKDLWNGLFA